MRVTFLIIFLYLLLVCLNFNQLNGLDQAPHTSLSLTLSDNPIKSSSHLDFTSLPTSTNTVTSKLLPFPVDRHVLSDYKIVKWKVDISRWTDKTYLFNDWISLYRDKIDLSDINISELCDKTPAYIEYISQWKDDITQQTDNKLTSELIDALSILIAANKKTLELLSSLLAPISNPISIPTTTPYVKSVYPHTSVINIDSFSSEATVIKASWWTISSILVVILCAIILLIMSYNKSINRSKDSPLSLTVETQKVLPQDIKYYSPMISR